MAVRNPNTLTRRRAGDIDGPHNQGGRSPNEDIPVGIKADMRMNWLEPVKDDEWNPETASLVDL
jgi:hypothetical protein